MATELGGKGNPRILILNRYLWEVGEPFDENTPVAVEYVVTLWDYTIEVQTRAQAAQLLHAISHISSRN
jgi:hypothetical protein